MTRAEARATIRQLEDENAALAAALLAWEHWYTAGPSGPRACGTVETVARELAAARAAGSASAPSGYGLTLMEVFARLEESKAAAAEPEADYLPLAYEP